LEFGTNDAIGRLCHRIIDLRHRYGHQGIHGRIVVDVPFSQAELANWAAFHARR
jgi:CRP-like cAMP-binding protein